MAGLPPSITALKGEARDLKKASGKPHHECLEQIARSYGFPNYHGAVSFYSRQEQIK
jgi:hypothetical protein